METDRLFNSTIAGVAVSAAFELGLLDELERRRVIHVTPFCDKEDLHAPSVAGILRALACFKIVELSTDAEVARQGEAFADVYRKKGYFLWLVKGYGHLLANLADFAKCKNRPAGGGDPSFVRRSPRHIAAAGRDYGSQFVDQYFEGMLNEWPFTVACDLGCGSAERLLNVAKKRSGVRGVGVDVDGEVIAFARDRIREESLEDRVAVLEGDARNLSPRPEFAEVDLLFCFFIGHDMWPRARCKQTLQSLLSIFPRARRFLLCDTYRSDAAPSPSIPTFTLGFELTHSVMGQYIPSEAEWLALFEETGWRCVGKQEIGIPFSAIFDLRPCRAPGA